MRVSAAVMLVIFLIAAIFVYLILLPAPVTYNLIYGNFSNQPISNSSQPIAAGSFYYPITSYVGGSPSAQNYSYNLGTFGISYSVYNSTVSGSAPFQLTSSIFGSSSYNINFNGSSTDKYFITLTIGKVSGSPRLKISLNGDYFYSAIPASGEKVTLAIPGVVNGKNIVSIYNDLNGLAFTQSISFSNVSITQTHSVSVFRSLSTSVLTIDGLGNFYLQFIPIGQGNLSVYVNNEPLASISSGRDVPLTIMLPPSIVNSAIAHSTSPMVTANFDTTFAVAGANTSYEIANGNIIYSAPVIPSQNLTFQYTLPQTSGEYIFTFYLDSILKQGQVTFSFYPSGQSFQISSSNLMTGQNTLILPVSALSSQISNGNYTGTVSVSSTGLVIPQYISIKPTS